MTTIEKLKRLTQLQSLPEQDLSLEMEELAELTDWYMRLFPVELIAMLEIIEQNANRTTIIYDPTDFIVRVNFARELLAALGREK